MRENFAWILFLAVPTSSRLLLTYTMYIDGDDSKTCLGRGCLNLTFLDRREPSKKLYTRRLSSSWFWITQGWSFQADRFPSCSALPALQDNPSSTQREATHHHWHRMVSTQGLLSPGCFSRDKPIDAELAFSLLPVSKNNKQLLIQTQACGDKEENKDDFLLYWGICIQSHEQHWWKTGRTASSPSLGTWLRPEVLSEGHCCHAKIQCMYRKQVQ